MVLCTFWLRRTIASAGQLGLLVKGYDVKSMDAIITDALHNFQAGCRLVFVPMPFPYAQMVKFLVGLYLFITPFAFVDQLKEGTPVGAFVLAMIFCSVEEIGVQIEDPFGKKSSLDKKSGTRKTAPHGPGQTHFVNLEVVVREIDCVTAMIIAERNGTAKHFLFAKPLRPVHTVCGHT